MDELLCISVSNLPVLPEFLLENPFLEEVGMTDLLFLRYFPKYVENLAADQRESACERINCALRIEFTGMLVGALVYA